MKYSPRCWLTWWLLLGSGNLLAIYTAAEVSVQSGFRNVATVVQGNNLLLFRNEAWFTTFHLHLALGKTDFFAGVNYLYSEAEIATLGKERQQGFGDPYAGFSWHWLYENYYLPALILESEVNIPTGEEPFSAKAWLNRTRVQLIKSFRPATLALSAAVLAPLGKPKEMPNQVGIFTLSLMRHWFAWFSAGLFADYHTNSLSDSTVAHHLGLQGMIPLTKSQFYFYGGKEVLQNSLGWFAGGGLRFFLW